MNKKIMMLLMVCISLIALKNVNAQEIINNENIDYIIKNANPEDIYLKNGKIMYSDEYLNRMKINN